jgi:hypothetical protein
MNEFSQEEIEEYEQELESTDVKALLIQQLAYLDAIYRCLEGAQGESEREKNYRCESCGSVYPESDLETHLVQQHNAPPNGVNPMDMFSEVS